jgi:uncharacterized protein (DUF433 family)
MKTHSPVIAISPQRVAELDQLGDEIAELSAHLEAATARLLDLIREFDTRGGWNNGFRSCADWLSWRVGLDLGAARERVRVARALRTLPLLAQAPARGELSYAKVRALTRVATPETEERLLAVGRAGTAAHVERIVRGWRRVDRKAEARETARQHASRALHVHRDEDGTLVLRGRLAPEVGALLLRALKAAREKLYQKTRGATTPPADPAAEPPTTAQQRADALALLAETALHHELDPGAPGERYPVVVHVDAPTLADPDQPGDSVLEDGSAFPRKFRVASRATRLASSCVTIGMGALWKSGPGRGRFPLHCGERSINGTGGAAFLGANSPSARDIMSDIGRKADRPHCRTLPCSVADTTAPCTRRATRSIERPTARSDSGDRTAGLCPRSRLRPRCPRIRFKLFAHSMMHRGYTTSTRGRRALAGWESAWMSAGRSTCCTPWPGETQDNILRLRSEAGVPRDVSGTHQVNNRYSRPMNLLRRITRDPTVMGGRPCIRGMRVTVGSILGLLAAGHTHEQILQAYPYLEAEDIPAALSYAAWRTGEVDMTSDQTSLRPFRPETLKGIAAVERALELAARGVGADDTTSKGGRDLVTATDIAVEDAVRKLLTDALGLIVIGEEGAARRPPTVSVLAGRPDLRNSELRLGNPAVQHQLGPRGRRPGHRRCRGRSIMA